MISKEAKAIYDSEYRQRDYVKVARKVHAKKYHKKFAERNSERNLIKKYGIEKNKFNELLLLQDNKCAICGKPSDKYDVDHNHANGNVRGLLCNICNRGLGCFHDDIEVLKSAIKYLEKDGKHD